MGLENDLETYVENVYDAKWTSHDGRKVPDTSDIALKNSAVSLSAAVLYADLGASTQMTRAYPNWFAAEMYKTFLYCASRIITTNNGTITAYDGDRVMAVFVGDLKNTSAARSALRINYAVKKIIQPRIDSKYASKNFTMKHRVGVDASDLYVARTGIRGNNDLVWVGNAANNAAKMAALPTTYMSYISATVYKRMLDTFKQYGNPPRHVWTDLGTRDLGYQIYGSKWTWTI